MGMQTDNAPLQDRESTGQLIARIMREFDRMQRDHHALSALIDSLIPDVDYRQHHEDHIQIRDSRIERRRMWSNLKSQAIAGVVMAIAGGAFGVLAYAITAWVKQTGGG